MKTKFAFGLAFSSFSSLSYAHPGHGLASVYTGFAHPFTGLDHLLVMLAIGIWAAHIGGKARWQLPLTFLALMTVGATLGLAGMQVAGVETAIAASVLAMGVLLMLLTPIQPQLRFLIVGVFALVHGIAHGVELSAQSTWAALVGMLLATALLHGMGLWLGQRLSQQQAISRLARLLHTSLAASLVLVGAGLLLSA